MTPLVLGGDRSPSRRARCPAWPSSIAAGNRRSVCSGSTPTPTSTRPRPRPRATCTACRWPRCWDSAQIRWPTSRLRPKIAPENTVLIGVRDIDAAERENIRRAGITESTHARHRRAGHESGDGRGAARAGSGTAGYHVSLDMDSIDPEDAPGVERRSAAALPTAKPTSPWTRSAARSGCGIMPKTLRDGLICRQCSPASH